MPEILNISRDGRVLRIEMNRAEKRNALSEELCRALAQALEDGDSDPAVGAILLTANGKAFCAGMDLGEVEGAPPEDLAAVHDRLFTVGARLDKPIVGAVGGAALGGGVGVVANCHIAIASPDATFGLTEIRLGLWPFLIYRAVAAAIGDRRTAELALTGRIFGPGEAKEMGLVTEVAPDHEGRALEVARGLAAASPTAIRGGLRFVRETRGKGWETAGEIAGRMRGELFRSADFREGVRAFREKRAPKWPSLG